MKMYPRSNPAVEVFELKSFDDKAMSELAEFVKENGLQGAIVTGSLKDPEEDEFPARGENWVEISRLRLDSNTDWTVTVSDINGKVHLAKPGQCIVVLQAFVPGSLERKPGVMLMTREEVDAHFTGSPVSELELLTKTTYQDLQSVDEDLDVLHPATANHRADLLAKNPILSKFEYENLEMPETRRIGKHFARLAYEAASTLSGYLMIDEEAGAEAYVSREAERAYVLDMLAKARYQTLQSLIWWHTPEAQDKTLINESDILDDSRSEDRLKLRKENPLLRLFKYEHLRTGEMKEISKQFARLAYSMAASLPGNNPEKTVCLRKLREAKDCAITALVWEDGNG